MWKESDSEIFIKYGACFIPDRERQIEIICDLIIPVKEDFNVVDLCCGEGLLSKSILERFPNARVHLYDQSETMITNAKNNLRSFSSRTNFHIFDIHSASWRKFNFPVHAFVSSLAIHHLDGDEKKQLFIDLFKLLGNNGVFLNADLIRFNHQLGMEVAAKGWDEETKKRSLALKGNLEGYEAFKKLAWNYFRDPDGDDIDKPSPIVDQVNWLVEAGFRAVDVFWLVAGHAIYGGYRFNNNESRL